MELLAGDVANLVRHLGYERTHLVGHDWGGAIAWCVPALHPGLVERLAILNAPHPILFRKKLATLAQAKRSSYVFFFQLPFFPERSLLRHRAGFLKMMLRRDPVTPGAFSPEEIEAYRDGISPALARRRRRSTTTARPSAPARGFPACGVPSTASRRSSSGARETATSAPSSSTAWKPSSPTSASSGSPTPATGSPPTPRSE